jgi:hypothetical protein
MRRRTRTGRSAMFLAVIVAALLVLVAALFATNAGAGGRPLHATLTGAAEVPGPGDPDGTGKARIRLNQGQRKVCFRLSWENIATPTAAHIHIGPPGDFGPVVVPLFTAPTESGCVNGVARSLIKNIRKHPGRYYVNIHTGDFPDGAIRGQLSKTKPKKK